MVEDRVVVVVVVAGEGRHYVFMLPHRREESAVQFRASHVFPPDADEGRFGIFYRVAVFLEGDMEEGQGRDDLAECVPDAFGSP